jgi:hypothetical protein
MRGIILLTISIWSCRAKADRDHLIFKNSIAEIFMSLLLIDSILINISEPNRT